MAGCFPDIRMRAHSFDMHELQKERRRANLITRLFRSKSETSVKKGSPQTSPSDSPKQRSPTDSPRGSPGSVPKRRFMRVVRDGEKHGEEYENPHLIRRYTKGYWEKTNLSKSRSLDDHATARGVLALPYTVTGHTILKKHSSFDSEDESQGSPRVGSPTNKHASFKEEVHVIGFDCKDKIESCQLYATEEKIHFDEEMDFFVIFEEDPNKVLEEVAEETNSKVTSSSPTQTTDQTTDTTTDTCQDNRVSETDTTTVSETDSATVSENTTTSPITISTTSQKADGEAVPPSPDSTDQEVEHFLVLSDCSTHTACAERKLSSDSDCSDCDKPPKKMSKVVSLSEVEAGITNKFSGVTIDKALMRAES